jgi:hypothetical protein
MEPGGYRESGLAPVPQAPHAAPGAPEADRGPGAAQLRAARAATWALEVLADPARTPPAVLHPLGFLCFPLLRAPGAGVCVHVWLPRRADFAPPLETTSVHSHSWDLLSYVLLGRIGNELVTTEPASSETATHRVYEIRSSQGADEVVPTSRCVRSRRREIRYAGSGEVYRLAGGEFHSSVVDADEDRGAATVLLADQRGGVDRALGPVRPGRTLGPVARRRAPAALSAFAARSVLDRARPVPPVPSSPPR